MPPVLWDASPSKTMTCQRFSSNEKTERKIEKLLEVTKAEDRRFIHAVFYIYNTAHQIDVYRLSSSIVPLATHPDVEWDFITPFKKEWCELGNWIKQHQLRVSFSS